MSRKTTLLLLLILSLAFIGLLGCASRQPEEEPPPAPVDTTGFEDDQQQDEDELLSAEEEERRRMEEQRLAEEKRRQQEQAAMKNLQTVYFAFDSSTLTSEAREVLRANAEIIRKYDNWSIVVEGHTDARGSTEYNLALGERRAYSVKQYYVDYGIDANRIRLISYGEERPAAQGSGEQAWSKNRRAVTTVR